MNITELLETHATNIFSPVKETRRHARAEFARLSHDFTRYPEYNEGEELKWVEVANAVHDAVKNHSFPYRIHPKKVSYEVINYVLDPNNFHPVIREPAATPGYIVLMAHGFNPNTVRDTNKVRDQILLLQNEGFLETSEVSQREARSRLRTVIGANFCYSLDSEVNRAGSRQLGAINQLATSTTKVTGFAWCPLWVTHNGLKKKDQVPLKTAKRLFRIIKDADAGAAEAIRNKLFKTKPIPMRLIREEIKNSQPVLSLVRDLRRGQRDRPLFAATWDDDALSLRTEGQGVFSCYDKLYRENPEMQVGTTGYIMRDARHDYTEVGSRMDLFCRTVFGRIAYLPEPNMVVKVPVNTVHGLDFKYLKAKKATEFKIESDLVLKSLNLNYANSDGKVIFGLTGPIITSADRVVIPNALRGRLSPQHFSDPDNLVKFRDFMQASFNPLIGFSATVLRALPGLGGQSNNGKVYALFKLYDPIEFAKAFRRDWVKLYDPFINAFIPLSNLDEANRDTRGAARDILAGVAGHNTTITKLSTYLQQSLNQFQAAKETLLRIPGMTDNMFLFIDQNAVNVSYALYSFIEAKINNVPLERPVFPKA